MKTAVDVLIDSLAKRIPILWINDDMNSASVSADELAVSSADMFNAASALDRFAPLLAQLFPELAASNGIIESPLVPAVTLQGHMHNWPDKTGKLFIKTDHSLPVAGSVKARGGLYEVLVIAEEIALENRLISADSEERLALMSDAAQCLFSQYTISVGSTGNLGLSIGMMSSALGFKCVVHMSDDAKRWKKMRLMDRGVTVVEHKGDYASAVAAGRECARSDPFAYFVDDENSLPLFLGYSVAALRLEKQLQEMQIPVDDNHPLFVYIPCGVGGAPGGITFGLKQLFGSHVHCFFAEPTESPCMLVQMALGEENASSVYDIGLTNKTDADGLAVASASRLVADIMRTLVSGIFTVPDQDLYRWLFKLEQTEGMKIEPSAAAGFSGPDFLFNSSVGQDYLVQHDLKRKVANSSHIIWTTGGSFVPPDEYLRFHKRGRVELETTSGLLS